MLNKYVCTYCNKVFEVSKILEPDMFDLGVEYLCSQGCYKAVLRGLKMSILDKENPTAQEVMDDLLEKAKTDPEAAAIILRLQAEGPGVTQQDFEYHHHKGFTVVSSFDKIDGDFNACVKPVMVDTMNAFCEAGLDPTYKYDLERMITSKPTRDAAVKEALAYIDSLEVTNE